MGEFEENRKLKVYILRSSHGSGNQGFSVTLKSVFTFCSCSIDIRKIRPQLILRISEL